MIPIFRNTGPLLIWGLIFLRLPSALALVLAASPVVAQTASLSKDPGEILRAADAHDVLVQCSRKTPEAPSDFWTPSVSDVRRLELALPAYLSIRAKQELPNPPSHGVYERQYIGYVENGRRLIYGNFFPHGLVRPERDRALVVCDGGPQFWGIVFDPKSGTFSHLEFNGPL